MFQHQSPSRQCPPLGDLSTSALIRHLVGAWLTGRAHPMLERRGAKLDDLRREIERREILGVGV